MNRLTILFFLFSIVLTGCKDREEVEFVVNGERVFVRIDDYNLRVFNDDRLIVRIFLTEERYSVDLYGSGFKSVTADYKKWEFTPLTLSRFVERDGSRYIIVYDNEGRISEEILVGEVE